MVDKRGCSLHLNVATESLSGTDARTEFMMMVQNPLDFQGHFSFYTNMNFTGTEIDVMLNCSQMCFVSPK